MFLKIWPLLSYFICATISLVLNSGILINLNAPVSGVTRLESPTATPLSTWAPVCDANLYGTPPLAGCREAVAKLRNRGEGAIVPYRQRGSPLFPGALSLPARYSSSDGLCAFEIRFRSPFWDESWSDPNIVKAGAENLLTSCVEGQDKGGRLEGLGSETKLQVQFEAYEPPGIVCRPDHVTAELAACEYLLGAPAFPASENERLFGKQGSLAREQLPRRFADVSGKCATVIDFLSGNAVRTSWYKIYSATVALVSICVAQGDNGYAILDLPGGQIKIQIKTVGPGTMLTDGSTVVVNSLSLPLNAASRGTAQS